MSARLVAIVAVAALLAAACTAATDADRVAAPARTTSTRATTTTPPFPAVDLDARPGPFQLTVDHVPVAVDPGAVLEVTDAQGRSLGMGEVAANGSALIRNLPPGPVRVFVNENGERVAEAPARTVPGTEAPPDGLYADATLDPGFGYVVTRDGTKLSAFVSLPGPVDEGPYPTVVEYSGYSPSRPSGNDPNRLILPTLGYALVQVNVRGTGCSGGSFDAFEPIQSLDGYDLIETVAAQEWSGNVGMFGISYAGIMQLHVASTRPPSLSAIAPLSVLDDVGSVLYPGGIYNSGFGETWTEQVSGQAAEYGQGWERTLVDEGDAICERNQRLRLHNPDLVARIRSNPYTTDLSIERSPATVAGDIAVPVFLAGAWQDEQTGGRWPALIGELDNAPVVRVLMYNGLHVDAVAPRVLSAVTEFYDLYLEDPDPGAGTALSLALAGGLSALFGQLLPIRFNQFDPTDGDALRLRYEDDLPIRVLFDQGATRANLPVPSFEAAFSTWPPAEATPTAFLIGVAGEDEVGLEREPVGAEASAAAGPVASFTTDPTEGSVTTITDLSGIWGNNPSWQWPAPEAGAAIDILTGPLAEDLTVVGPASADLWLTADATDGDIEVTVSEIQPDGSRTYVQSGWLRLSQRALRPSSTVLRPIPTGLEADVQPLTPGGEPVLARVEILPFGHVFRAGSRLALTIDTPGASRPQWTFDVLPQPVTIELHSDELHRSQLVLPVVEGFTAPTPRPACGSLRGQPCVP